MKTHPELDQLRASLEEAERIQRELDQRVFHLKTLYDVSRDIFATVDSEKILKNFLLMTMGNFGVVEGFILTMETSSQEISPFVQVGLDEADLSRIMASARQFLLPDGQAWSDYLDCVCLRPDFLPAEIICALPFALEQDFVGLLGLGAKMVGEPFNENDQELLFTLVNNLVVALRHARSFEEIEHLNRSLQAQNVQLEKAYRELQEAQAHRIEKEKLERELHLAWEIQHSMLPRSLPRLAGFDFGARIVPARVVGGDFYDFIPLADHALGVAVGDVSGKGLPAAIFMAMTRSLMRAEASKTRSPQEALRGVNKQLLGMNEASMFVSVLYGILNRRTLKFHYARAGHELPLLCNASGVVAPPCLPGQPLAIFPDPEIDEQVLQMNPGDTLLLFTDGITDAMDEHGERFGAEGLYSCLSVSFDISPQRLCDRLIDVIMAHQQRVSQYDDATVVAARSS
jgi:serine phosphatase RsbU (regulator of sigma subunit)